MGYELLMKFGPTAQFSFETHVFRGVQSEILIHVRDSHAILLTEFPPLALLVCGGNSRSLVIVVLLLLISSRVPHYEHESEENPTYISLGLVL